MKRPDLIIIAGLLTGLVCFIGFNILTLVNILPFGTAFNNFFSMIGLILFFISGFFYLSSKTLKNQKK